MTLPAHMSYARYLLVFALSLLASSAQAKPKPGSDCVFWDKYGEGFRASDASSPGSDSFADGWVSEPNMRGATTIVTTCLVTLGLCVWTSIHVDVDHKARPPLLRLWRKAKKSLRALLLPSLVVQASYEQCREMERLYEALADVKYIHVKTKEAKNTPSQSPDDKKGPEARAQPVAPCWDTLKRWVKERVGLLPKAKDPNYPFSKEVAFFVIMKGFVRPPKTEELPETEDEEERKRRVITPEDFFNAYARNPDAFGRMIEEKEILDKGNASNIAKLIILAQVTKLVLQMIGRKAQGLSVAVLELHIFVHILIAGLLYSFWWYKQLDVNEPIELDIGDRYWAPDRMWSYYPEQASRFKVRERFKQCWQPSGRFRTDDPYPRPPPGKSVSPSVNPSLDCKTEVEMKAMTRDDFWREAVIQINAMRFVEVYKSNDENNDRDQTGKPKPNRLTPADCLYIGDHEPDLPLAPDPEKSTETIGQARPGQEIQTTTASKGTTHAPSSGERSNKQRARRAFSPPDRKVREKTDLKRGVRACCFYIVYAGLHAAVWHEENFPSSAEKWVWRGACIGIAGVPVILVVLGWAKYQRGWAVCLKDQESEGDAESQGCWREVGGGGKLWKWLRKLFTLEGFLQMVYLFASIALLGESFAALRKEDADTYRVGSWTSFLRIGA